MLITHIHTSNNHCELSHTLSLYRQQILTPKIRSRLKSVLLRCIPCIKLKAKTIERLLPPPLPRERPSWVAPFADVTGQRRKLYIHIFVCTTTRAVHLELVDNLSTHLFLLCLRKLAATKGAPSMTLSDNPRRSCLLELHEDPDVQAYLNERRIAWKQQTQCAPWCGGHFERFVRIVKTCLRSAISRKLFNWEEFSTVVKEVETIVNSRPLTYQSTDASDSPLTPFQLMWGRDLTLLPPLLLPDQLDEENFNKAKAARHQYYLISSALDRFHN